MVLMQALWGALRSLIWHGELRVKRSLDLHNFWTLCETRSAGGHRVFPYAAGDLGERLGLWSFPRFCTGERDIRFAARFDAGYTLTGVMEGDTALPGNEDGDNVS